jgi:hypothetical protein
MDTKVMPVSDVGGIDWSQNSMGIGVKLPRGDEEWTALDKDDLKILHNLLTKRLVIAGNDGLPRYLDPAASASEGLNLLAAAVKSMINWYENGR